MSKTAKLANGYLKEHGLDKMYSTSDGYLFEKKQNALTHAKSLKEKKVKTHYRNSSEVQKSVEEVSSDQANVNDTSVANKAEKTEKDNKPEDASETGDAALQKSKKQPNK